MTDWCVKFSLYVEKVEWCKRMKTFIVLCNYLNFKGISVLVRDISSSIGFLIAICRRLKLASFTPCAIYCLSQNLQTI